MVEIKIIFSFVRKKCFETFPLLLQCTVGLQSPWCRECKKIQGMLLEIRQSSIYTHAIISFPPSFLAVNHHNIKIEYHPF